MMYTNFSYKQLILGKRKEKETQSIQELSYIETTELWLHRFPWNLG